MFNLLKPTICTKDIHCLSLDILHKMRIRALFVDVDNTLSKHGSQKPFTGSIEWANLVKQNGIEIVIISNNYKRRVLPFASKYNLPFISFAMKPLPFCFFKAKKLLNLNKLKNEECMVVGDQIFTDIIGANLCKMKSALLEPIEEEKSFLLKTKRKFEKFLRKKLNINLSDLS